MRTVMVSSSRSITIAANAPVALIGSRRERKYGRTSSPAAAGRKLRAAKPTAVARNELAKLALPRGWSRNCQRQARITRLRMIVRNDRNSHPGWACTISRATPTKSTFLRNNPSSASASTTTTIVRMWARMDRTRSLLYRPSAPLARSRYMLLLSPHGVFCKMRHFPARTFPLSFAAPVLNTSLASRGPDRHGKVRDIYDFGDRLLIVATDRISAFDYVLGTGIPDKGKVLTQISAFWFARLRGIVDH